MLVSCSVVIIPPMNVLEVVTCVTSLSDKSLIKVSMYANSLFIVGLTYHSMAYIWALNWYIYWFFTSIHICHLCKIHCQFKWYFGITYVCSHHSMNTLYSHPTCHWIYSKQSYITKKIWDRCMNNQRNSKPMAWEVIYVQIHKYDLDAKCEAKQQVNHLNIMLGLSPCQWPQIVDQQYLAVDIEVPTINVSHPPIE